MVSQDRLAQKVRSFSKFSKIMTELPSLKAMKSEQRDHLLRDLHCLAGGKAMREKFAEQKRRAVPLLRAQRRQVSGVAELFSEAAGKLEEACKFCGVEVAELEGADVGDIFTSPQQLGTATAIEKTNSAEPQFLHFTGPTPFSERLPSIKKILADPNYLPPTILPVPPFGTKVKIAGLIAKHLRNSAEKAIQIEQRIAANIPSSRRLGPEKELARHYFSSIYGGEEPDAPQQFGPKTPAIDHWLIGAAASFLDKYQSKNGRKIRGHIRIIARLFEAAFGDRTRSEESVRKELRRQKTRGRPEYSITVGH